MELRQLLYFLEVARQEHMSLAADTLHIAQSAVSRQISNLEDELGVQLFEREGRNIKLTYIGRMFSEKAAIAINALDDAKQLINEYLDPERGSIRIGFPSSLATNTLPQIINAFKKNHQDVCFHLRQGSYNFLIEGIKRREIDLAFIGPVPTRDPDIHTDILFVEHFVGLIPQEHPLASKEIILLRQLENDSFVLFPKGFILRKIAEDACLQSGFRPKIPFEGEDLDAIKGLVSSGMGVTLLPEITLQDNIPNGTLVKRITQPDIRRTVGIITPKNRELSPSEKLFYDFVLDYYSILSRQQELD